MSEKILVIETKNKKGSFKKTKWHLNSVVISMAQYNEYLDLKDLKETIDAVQHYESIRWLLELHNKNDLQLCEI